MIVINPLILNLLISVKTILVESIIEKIISMYVLGTSTSAISNLMEVNLDNSISAETINLIIEPCVFGNKDMAFLLFGFG